MLQERRKHWGYRVLGLTGLLVVAISCKPDTSTFSEEKSAYLADYEIPSHPWGFIDTTGKLQIPAIYDEVGQFSEGLAAINLHGLWGYINPAGKIIIQPQFRSAYSFHENRARVTPFDQPDGYITPSGKLISSGQWSASDDFSGGRAKVKAGDLYGFIDSTGAMIIQPIYTRAWKFDHGLAIVEYQGKQGVIQPAGNYLVNPIYDKISLAVQEGFLLVTRQNDGYLLDLRGKERDRLPGASFVETDGNLVSFWNGAKMNLYNVITKTWKGSNGFDQLMYLGHHRWSAKADGAYHLLNETGITLDTFRYMQINKFEEGMAAFEIEKQWGYMDTSGHHLTDPVLAMAWDYHLGFARVAFKDGVHFLNRSQQIAFYPPARTLNMRDFNEGLCPVQLINSGE